MRKINLEVIYMKNDCSQVFTVKGNRIVIKRNPIDNHYFVAYEDGNPYSDEEGVVTFVTLSDAQEWIDYQYGQNVWKVHNEKNFALRYDDLYEKKMNDIYTIWRQYYLKKEMHQRDLRNNMIMDILVAEGLLNQCTCSEKCKSPKC